MASSRSIISAAQDDDLRLRAIALAAELGIDSPEAWVDSQRYQLASAPVSAGSDTIASVYEYAKAQYDAAVASMPKAPGKDDAYVTDEHLRFALRKLSGVTNAPA